MNRITLEKKALMTASLVEGSSLRVAARVAKVSFNTVLSNSVLLGKACQRLHDEKVQNLTCSTVEADELWSFIHAKDKNLPARLKGNRDFGDMYTWTAFDPDTKLAITWHVGKREFSDAQTFANDLAARVPGQVQITTDQLTHYRSAIEGAFGARADYVAIRKMMVRPTPKTADGKYEQPQLSDTSKRVVSGNPDLVRSNTGFVERMNLSIRQSMSRYRRSSNTYSKIIENARAALALNFTYYNFCRISPQIRVTPAMEAGLANHVWEIEELVGLVEK